MNWFEPVSAYCERSGPQFWAEPANALSNAAFLLAAAAAARRAAAADPPDRTCLGLAALIAAVGVGSFLFHTLAVYWAMLADVVPIALFIYAYLALALSRFLRLAPVRVAAATGGVRPPRLRAHASSRRPDRPRRRAADQRLGRLPARPAGAVRRRLGGRAAAGGALRRDRAAARRDRPALPDLARRADRRPGGLRAAPDRHAPALARAERPRPVRPRGDGDPPPGDRRVTRPAVPGRFLAGGAEFLQKCAASGARPIAVARARKGS